MSRLARLLGWFAAVAVAAFAIGTTPGMAQIRFGVEGPGGIFIGGGGGGGGGNRGSMVKKHQPGVSKGDKTYSTTGKGARGRSVATGDGEKYPKSPGKRPPHGRGHGGTGIVVGVPVGEPTSVDEPDEPKGRGPRPRRPVVSGGGGSGRPPYVGIPMRRPTGTPPAPIGPLAGDRRDREILVTLADATQDNVIGAVGRAYRLSQQSSFRSATLGVRMARFRIPDRRGLGEVLGQLAQDQRVIAVQPVYLYYSSQGAAGAAASPPQYAVDMLRLTEAHRLARGRNVAVAIVDSGIDLRHPELKGASIEPYDATGKGSTAPEEHGTAIAGIVAARQQLQGAAPDARILAVRSFSQAGGGRFEGTTETLIKGIDIGLAHGARVFNLSFTGPKDPSIEQIIRIAAGKGAILVAAAGNGGPDAPAAYPAAYDAVIAVTAVDRGDKVYARANRGSYIAFAAPGVDILAPAPKQAYGLSSGTSMAAAYVSGIAALLTEVKPGLSAAEVRKYLVESARSSPAEPKSELGAGVVDAERALEALRSMAALR
jgi:hypothetical protein